MKRTELQVGVEYAYRESIYRDVHRVKIVALDAPRGGIGYNKNKRDAIEIEYVGEQPARRFPTQRQPKAGDRWVITGETQPGRLFLAPWDQYVATEAENQRAEAARTAAEGRQRANANAIRAALGLAEDVYGWGSPVWIDATDYPAVARKLGITLPYLPEAASDAD